MSQTQQTRDVIEQKGPNQIVRIQSDSETNLDDLFKAVMSPKGNQMSMGVPMRLRNLPPSFFQQPERGSKSTSHSRESSLDNTNYSSPPPSLPSQQQKNANSPPTQAHPSGVPINHPRAHSSPASLQQTYNNNTSQHQHLRQQSYDITDEIPLPFGWQMAKTDTGQVYFLNHLTKTTTWEDPRKKLSTGSLSSNNSTTSPPSPILNLQHLAPLPEFWEQATSTDGEIYFINHETCTTTWYDPRIPMHLQQPPMVPISGSQRSLPQLPGIAPPPTIAATLGTATINSQLTQQQQQQKLRLQRLELERERLRMRQQEIFRQQQATSFGSPFLNEMMMRHTLKEESSSTTSPTSSTSDMQSSTHTNVDPFLSGGNDFHSRQESADSGLGLGTNYSLPNTPEDYLISMDDGMEANIDISRELTLEGIHSSNLDLVTENMDSDDLVPSLHEELNADILSDVEALLNPNKDVEALLNPNKDTVMKWL